jgi:hypothetical protein
MSISMQAWNYFGYLFYANKPSAEKQNKLVQNNGLIYNQAPTSSKQMETGCICCVLCLQKAQVNHSDINRC